MTAGGPAAAAGLKVGDIITSVAGRPTTGPDSIFLITVAKSVGDQVQVEYVRNEKRASTNVTLGNQP